MIHKYQSSSRYTRLAHIRLFRNGESFNLSIGPCIWYHCTATRCCPRMKGELLGAMERCQFSSFQERSRTTFWPLKPTVGDWWKAEFAGNLNRGKER